MTELEIENIKNVDIDNEKEEKPKKRRGRPRKEEGKHSKDPEQCQAYQKQYYEKNKEKLLKDLKEKVTCQLCGKQTSKCNLLTHQRSSKCKVSHYVAQGEKLDKLVTEFSKLKKQKEKLKDKAGPEILNRLKEIFFEIKKI
jgi:hypothetical protein